MGAIAPAEFSGKAMLRDCGQYIVTGHEVSVMYYTDKMAAYVDSTGHFFYVFSFSQLFSQRCSDFN